MRSIRLFGDKVIPALRDFEENPFSGNGLKYRKELLTRGGI